jgi:hypothetical protein
LIASELLFDSWVSINAPEFMGRTVLSLFFVDYFKTIYDEWDFCEHFVEYQLSV